ncbi:MAG: Gfo/Idh/MocA family oxidoreductase [Bacteroidota bacterium]
MHNFHINRRRFLKTAAASLALSTMGAQGLELVFRERPLRVGLIGTGWYGKSDLFRLMQVTLVEVVGLCDVDEKQLAEAAQLVKSRQSSGKLPPTFTNYQRLLAEVEMDVVLIGTPDHWHALQAIDVMKAGAHVYLQKPISVDVLEGEAIVAAAKKYDRTVQIGTQRRSTHHLIDAKEKIVEAGLLGKISHVEMCCYYHMRDRANRPTIEIPEHFDYDAWCGPAPVRRFDGVPHRRWRAFMEYGNGIMGDMCVHMLDTVRWLLDLGWPKRISSTGGIYVQKESAANTADTQHALFEFEELNAIWQHRSWGTPPDPDYPWAFFIYGEKGTLKGSVYKYDFIPQGKDTPLQMEVRYEREQFPEDLNEKAIELHTAPATRAHMLDFLSAIGNKKKPVADVLNGHISSASCIMANLSMDLGGRPLVYDPQQQIIVDDTEATQLLKRDYREGFAHPFR